MSMPRDELPQVAAPSPTADVIQLHRWGAYPEDWSALADGHGLLDDLLPVVSNPGATIAPTSKLSTLGKVPSRYNAEGLVTGIARWTEHHTTAADIERWQRVPDFGISVQTRGVLALDADIEDAGAAARVKELFADSLGAGVPVRWRANSNKFLIPVWVESPEPITKRRLVLPNGLGAVELLGHGQQFIAVGTHPSGARYAWTPGGTSSPVGSQGFARLELEELEALWLRLRDALGADDSRSAATRPRLEQMNAAVQSDIVATWLFDNGRVLDQGRDGQLYVECPNAAEHSVPPTGAGDTSTCYYPANTGGFQTGHWVCLHAHCAGKPDSFFTHLLDMLEFEDLTDVPPPVVRPQTFEELTTGAPVAPGGEGAGADEGGPGEPVRFQPIPVEDFLARAASTRWRIKHILPVQGVGTIFGPSGAAKSFSVLDMLCHVALGRDWQGKRVNQGRVVYLAAEGQGGVGHRLRAWCQHHDVAPGALDLAVIDTPPNLLQRDDTVALAHAVGRCAVLVIDTAMAVAAGGDENSSEDMGRLMKFVGLLARSTGGLVLLVHHAGKDVGRGQRGWSGLKGAIDVEIEVTRISEGGEFRQVRLSKVRDGPEEGTKWTFRLLDVELGTDEDGDPYGSAVCEWVEPPVGSGRGAKLGKNEQKAFEAAMDTIKLGTLVPVGELLDEVVRRMIADPTKRDARRQHAKSALENLERKGLIVFMDDSVGLPNA